MGIRFRLLVKQHIGKFLLHTLVAVIATSARPARNRSDSGFAEANAERMATKKEEPVKAPRRYVISKISLQDVPEWRLESARRDVGTVT